MSGETLFISDLHLDAERPAITELFLQFLRGPAAGADALYILGDLFEAWVGDDDLSPHHQRVIDGLHELTGRGVPLHVMHGNRDFLLGAAFADASGATLLAEPAVIDLYGTPTLLLHGDILCTDDRDYMQFRAMVRDSAWQQKFLARPLAERHEMARQAREQSRRSASGKGEQIMDVNPEAVTAALRRHGVGRLIHGHTHRPAIHRLAADHAPATRIVLGDWYEQGSVLHCDATGCRLQQLPPPRV
ncbi:MAG: UDP-2,3-diacylglucosamine diphosphatase [Gammaproteobacteria bacterium]